ncbi:MAG: hypothetical protein QM811_12900 [Pirellulales bacterium]
MAGIFLIQPDGSLVEMTEAKYDSEALLQTLLATHPNLLAGDQIDAGHPRRWLLVRREMPVPSELNGANRWSIDHLFLDQDAVPTLIEVKRSTDTRIRREVVGQMLDYAANAVTYWPVEEFRAQFEQECESSGKNADEILKNFLGEIIEAEQFWQKAKTNLQAGKIRMIFIADRIPTELRRIIEFLNEQMDPAEVLGIEIKQFLGKGGLRSLVPRVIGQTAEAEQKKRVLSNKQPWDESRFYEEYQKENSAEVLAACRALHQTMKLRSQHQIVTGGKNWGNIYPRFDDDRGPQQVFNISTTGGVGVNFGYQKCPPFNDEDNRLELLRRLNEVPGVRLKFTDNPSFKLSDVVEQNGMTQLVGVVEWAIKLIETTRPERPTD